MERMELNFSLNGKQLHQDGNKKMNSFNSQLHSQHINEQMIYENSLFQRFNLLTTMNKTNLIYFFLYNQNINKITFIIARILWITKISLNLKNNHQFIQQVIIGKGAATQVSKG